MNIVEKISGVILEHDSEVGTQIFQKSNSQFVEIYCMQTDQN